MTAIFSATLVFATVLAGGPQSPAPTAPTRPTAQTPAPPAPAVAAPGPVGETETAGDLWLVIYSVLPDRVADFETVARQVRDALGKSADPVRQAQARNLRIHRSSLPNAEGRLMYFLQVPALAGDADRSGFDVLIDAVLPEQATMLKQQLTGSLDARNPSGNTYLITVR